MLCEFSNNDVQTINPGESAMFSVTEVPCYRGFVRHREGTGNFLLSGYVYNKPGCRCCSQNTANYMVEFGANIAVPTTGTVGPISVGITIDGATIPSSQMIATPAAVEEYQNVSVAKIVDVFKGCCQTVTVRNLGDQPILMQNANIVISRPDLYMSY